MHKPKIEVKTKIDLINLSRAGDFIRGQEKGGLEKGRVLLVLLPGLRGMAAEVEGGTAGFWGIDIGDGGGLAGGVGPGFPAVVAALGGFFVVAGDVARTSHAQNLHAGKGRSGRS